MAKSNYINVLLISGSGIIGGLLNYIYHPIMLQFLSLEEFGEFGSLIGIFNILGVIFTGLILFLNKEISNNINNNNKIKHIFISSTKILAILGFIFYFIYLLFSPIISNFLSVNIKLIWIVGIGMILGFLTTSITSTLRGLKKFEFIGFQQVITPIIKLSLGVGLVYFGTKVYGAIWGFILSSLIVFLISFYYLYNQLKTFDNKGTTKELINDFLKNKKEIIHFFFISLFFAIFMNIDVILVKNIFEPEIAGIYIGLAVLGKFMIFLLLSIETVYYGQIMEYKKDKVPFYLIKNPLMLISVTSIVALVVNYILGGFILSILKKELVDYTNIYLLTLVYYSLIAFISFFIKILIGWKEYYINYIMGILTILLIFIIYTFGTTDLKSFIYSFIFIGIIGTIISSIVFFYEYRKV